MVVAEAAVRAIFTIRCQKTEKKRRKSQEGAAFHDFESMRLWGIRSTKSSAHRGSHCRTTWAQSMWLAARRNSPSLAVTEWLASSAEAHGEYRIRPSTASGVGSVD